MRTLFTALLLAITLPSFGALIGRSELLLASNELRNAIASIGTRPVYYVDSVNGSDSNTGTNPAAPWLTIQKLTNTIGAMARNVEVRLARGSQWREELRLGSNNIVRAYGSGPRPILNAANVATNWVKLDGYNNIYAISNWAFVGGVADALPVPVENGRQFHFSNSLAAVEATPGVFYTYSTNAVAGTSTNVFYINPRITGNPATNGGAYEIPVRDYGFYGGDHNTVEDIHTMNNLGNNGSFEVRRNCFVRGVIAENGTKHNFFIASGVAEDCLARNAEFALSSATLFVSHDTIDGGKVIYRRCVAEGRPDDLAQATGFYSHTEVGGYREMLFEDCEARYVQSFGSAGINTNGIAVWNRCSSIGVSLSGWSSYAGTNVFIDCRFLAVPSVTFSPSGAAFGVANNNAMVWIAGSFMHGASYGISVSSGVTNARVEVHQNFFNTDGGTGYGVASLSSGTNSFIVSNNVFRVSRPYALATNNVPIAANSNAFFQVLNFTVNGVDWATWGAYTNTLSPMDRNSLTNDLEIVGSPDNGQFTYSSTSPAVTNKAGPGWEITRIPNFVRGVDARRPSRLVGGIWLENEFRKATNWMQVSKVDSTNGTSYGQTANSFKVNGSWTNTSAATAQWDATSNLELNLNKGNNDGFTLWQNFKQNGTTYGRAGLLANSTHQFRVEGVTAGIAVIAGSNPVQLHGGGAGADRIQFYGADNGTLYGRLDNSGNWFYGSKVTITNGMSVGRLGAATVLTNTISASATLNFGITSVGSVEDLPITVTGAAPGDIVSLGVPIEALSFGTFFGFASNDTVYVRFVPTAATQNPGSGTFKVRVDQFQ